MACLLATIATLPCAQADEAQRRRVIEQKAALVQRVLEESTIARRVAAGGSDAAREQLARAAERHRRALALATEGRFAASEAAIDEAMVCIARARQFAPDPAQAGAELRARFEALLESTQSMLAAARRQARTKSSVVAAAALERGAEFVAAAVRMAGETRIEQAYRTLLQAERALLEALPSLLGTTTLDYALRFDSPRDELRYETERYDSFRRLVPIALAQLRPVPEKLQQVDQHLLRATRLHESAAAESERGGVAAALDAQREATMWLQRALNAAGLVVPEQ